MLRHEDCQGTSVWLVVQPHSTLHGSTSGVSASLCQPVCCVRLWILPQSHRLHKCFGMKVAQTRISEYVVPPHCTLHSSTSACLMVGAGCVMLQVVNLYKNKKCCTNYSARRMPRHFFMNKLFNLVSPSIVQTRFFLQFVQPSFRAKDRETSRNHT